METENKGIDYSLGQANVDSENGIRYGVIPVNAVLEVWAGMSEPYYPCGDCEYKHGDECSIADCEPSSWYIDDKEYQVESTDGIDIFVTKSPYYTLCQFCSPCAPGAGYVLNTCKDGIKAYCFGHDWFEDGKAPYPVYRVSDDTIVS